MDVSFQPTAPLQLLGLEWAMAICFVALGLLVIFLLIAFWVYQDAESRGMSGILWFILVFLLPVIGLILYLILRTERQPMGYPPPPAPPPVAPGPPPAPVASLTCRQCGATLAPGTAFCAQCGSKVV